MAKDNKEKISLILKAFKQDSVDIDYTIGFLMHLMNNNLNLCVD